MKTLWVCVLNALAAVNTQSRNPAQTAAAFVEQTTKLGTQAAWRLHTVLAEDLSTCWRHTAAVAKRIFRTPDQDS